MAKPIWGPVCSILTFAPDFSGSTNSALPLSAGPHPHVIALTPLQGKVRGHLHGLVRLLWADKENMFLVFLKGDYNLFQGPSETSLKEVRMQMR